MSDKTFTLITHGDDGQPVEKTISIKAKTNGRRKPKDCKHRHVMVDEELWGVECRDCGEKLDPIAYLVRLANDEADMEWRVDELRQERNRIMDILALKTKTRCEHCRKMTTINTEGDIKKMGLLLRYVDTGKNEELNSKKRTGGCKGKRDDGTEKWDCEFYLLRETAKDKIYICKYCGTTITEEKQNE